MARASGWLGCIALRRAWLLGLFEPAFAKDSSFAKATADESAGNFCSFGAKIAGADRGRTDDLLNAIENTASIRSSQGKQNQPLS
jgi:hypothetical protein